MEKICLWSTKEMAQNIQKVLKVLHQHQSKPKKIHPWSDGTHGRDHHQLRIGCLRIALKSHGLLSTYLRERRVQILLRYNDFQWLVVPAVVWEISTERRRRRKQKKESEESTLRVSGYNHFTSQSEIWKIPAAGVLYGLTMELKPKTSQNSLRELWNLS